MLDIAVKNVFRQKVRSMLTMMGIALGIGLILALGSIGEGLNQQITQQFGDVGAVIDVRDASDNNVGISQDAIDELQSWPEVESAIPIGSYRITRGFGGGFGGGFGEGRGIGGRAFFGTSGPATSITFTGVNPDDQDYLIGEDINTVDGNKLDSSDDGNTVVVLGNSIAQSQNLNVGDDIQYDRRTNQTTETYYFEVIGILEATGDSSIDNAAYVPLKTMQEIEDDDRITSLKVKVTDVSLVENVTQEINDQIEDVRATSFVTIVRQIESTLQTVQLAVYGIGAISIIVGGLGVMNTMIMSVMERRREIGIMKAIGATTGTILLQVLQESAFLSLIGGLVGLALGYLSAGLITEYTTFNAVLTPNLIAIALGFSVFLGMGAGIYPAWSASQLDPIEVLRYE
ncbi:MAG: ABC transporter permease [Candidatus Altiarchaeota archaeon]|nr:ABC transporter permease [Candidatus Altiarchaeota archaeon]